MLETILDSLVTGFKVFCEFALFTVTMASFFASIYLAFVILTGQPHPWYLILSPFVLFFGLGLIDNVDFD